MKTLLLLTALLSFQSSDDKFVGAWRITKEDSQYMLIKKEQGLYSVYFMDGPKEIDKLAVVRYSGDTIVYNHRNGLPYRKIVFHNTDTINLEGMLLFRF